MAKFSITEKECSEILALRKRIKDDISWTQKPNKSWSTAKVTVENAVRMKLEIRITVNNEESSKFSVIFLLNGTYRIWGLDVGGSHNNKCTDNKRWDCQIHKHCWNDACPGGHAYTPVDITGTTLREIFEQFCNECNIEFEGYFNPLPIQKQLKGV